MDGERARTQYPYRSFNICLLAPKTRQAAVTSLLITAVINHSSHCVYLCASSRRAVRAEIRLGLFPPTVEGLANPLLTYGANVLTEVRAVTNYMLVRLQPFSLQSYVPTQLNCGLIALRGERIRSPIAV